MVPANLVEILSHGQIENITVADELLRGLHTLSLATTNGEVDIIRTLRKAPCLQKLSIHCQAPSPGF